MAHNRKSTWNTNGWCWMCNMVMQHDMKPVNCKSRRFGQELLFLTDISKRSQQPVVSQKKFYQRRPRYVFTYTLLWMVAKSCVTFDGWNPNKIMGCLPSFSTGAGFRNHPQYRLYKYHPTFGSKSVVFQELRWAHPLRPPTSCPWAPTTASRPRHKVCGTWWRTWPRQVERLDEAWEIPC